MAPPKLLSLSVLVSVVSLAAAEAGATDLGAGRTTLMVGAERLFGLSVSRTQWDDGGGPVVVNRTEFTMVFSSGSQSYTTPRLAFDMATTSGLTLGGSAGL